MARHVHADLIIEALEDTSIKWQSRRIGHTEWHDCGVSDGELPPFAIRYEYRKKPREFQEGHWYPVSVEWGDYEDDFVLKFKGGEFHHGNEQYSPEQFKWIGESLGELKFG